jgi:raffinose/stachyose/melibiose transport system substrate-binding protein
MRRKTVALISLVITLTLALTACSGASATTANMATQGETTTAAPASSEPVKITLMQSKTEIQNDLQTVIDDFNSSHPEIEVELLGTSGDNYATVLQSSFAADAASAPTIFSLSGPDSPKFQQFYATLDDTAAAKILPDSLKPEFTVNQSLYGLPSSVEGYGLIYNADMFAQANIDPASLTSIDALVSACQDLAKIDGVKAPIGFAKETYFIFIHFFNWATALDSNYHQDLADVASGSKTMADIATVKQWALDLDKILPYTNKGLASYDDQVAGFSAGQYAMIHQGNWAQQVIDQNEVTFNYGFIPYPTSNNDKLAVGTATAWRVNNQASVEQQAAAKTFLDWLITSEQGQTYSADLLQFIPAYKGVKAPAGKLTESVANFVSQSKTVGWVYNTDFPTGIDVDGAAAMEKYYAGQINSEELLNEITAAWVKDSK